MKVIDFVVRDGAGALQRGLIQADEPTTTIQATSDQEISLNLRQADMQGHARDGDALNIVLADGPGLSSRTTLMITVMRTACSSQQTAI